MSDVVAGDDLQLCSYRRSIIVQARQFHPLHMAVTVRAESAAFPLAAFMVASSIVERCRF